jgi:hypothetical protein
VAVGGILRQLECGISDEPVHQRVHALQQHLRAGFPFIGDPSTCVWVIEDAHIADLSPVHVFDGHAFIVTGLVVVMIPGFFGVAVGYRCELPASRDVHGFYEPGRGRFEAEGRWVDFDMASVDVVHDLFDGCVIPPLSGWGRR